MCRDKITQVRLGKEYYESQNKGSKCVGVSNKTMPYLVLLSFERFVLRILLGDFVGIDIVVD